jgi:hypothetical protein
VVAATFFDGAMLDDVRVSGPQDGVVAAPRRKICMKPIHVRLLCGGCGDESDDAINS